jgi:DNA repair protein RecO (recombination protein O)
MLFKTKGIVMRSVKYGETSLVVTIFTELFGTQTYMVNGVRTSSLKTVQKASQFQPATLLEMVVYHQGSKSMQRIRESRWSVLYRHIFQDIRKNAVALFMVELLQKCLRQPEPNADLFHFTEDALMHLDQAEPMVTANFPLYFALHLAHFFGYRISDDHDAAHGVLDLREGEFVSEEPQHSDWIGGLQSTIVSTLLKTLDPAELADIPLNQESRRELLRHLLHFYALRNTDFGTLKSVPVLQEVLD